MTTSFKYTFVKSTHVASRLPAGCIGPSLSFSADGWVLAVGKSTTPASVSFLNVSDGSSARKVEGYFSGLFMRTEADKILLSKYNQFTEMFKRDSGGSTWKRLGITYGSNLPTSLDSGNGDNFFFARNEGFDLFKAINESTLSMGSLSAFPTALACAPDGTSLVLGYGDGSLQYLDYPTDGSEPRQFRPSQFSNGKQTEITACVWSHDGRLIASGDAAGVVCLWDVITKGSIRFKDIIEPQLAQDGRINRINRLIFDPDNTILIISNGSQLDVWDISQRERISVPGLPFTAQNIALDCARRRVAIAIGMDVFLYDMKAVVDSSGGGDEPSNVPSDLEDMDITSKVTKSVESTHIPGLFQDVYRGAFEVHYPKRLLHVVAIKSFKTDFNSQSSEEQRKKFQSTLYKELNTWLKLDHPNLVPLLGVTTTAKPGELPSIVTSWMVNGILNKYLKSKQIQTPPINKMKLIKGIAEGVSYLHSEGVIHGDLRASSILIDEVGNPAIADIGLLKILKDSPLLPQDKRVSIATYRWMAPELLDGSSKMTTASDVFAYTMTCLEVYTGDIPFPEVKEDFPAGMKIARNDRPPRPSGISNELWTLWENGWNGDVAKRSTMTHYVECLNAMA